MPTHHDSRQYQLAVQTFEFDGQMPVRTVEINGEVWFVAADVCRVLDIAQPASSLRSLDEDEKGVHTVHTPGGDQKMAVINESGLYSLILTSRKPAAKKFKKWVTAEVLPAIRKSGGYGQPAIHSFVRRANANWGRVSPGYFSVINELYVLLHGKFEMTAGYQLSDTAPDGKMNMPDISVGRTFSDYLAKHHPELQPLRRTYSHILPNGKEVEAYEYPRSVWPHFADFVDNVWIPERAADYFKRRDPKALAHLPKMLPKAS